MSACGLNLVMESRRILRWNLMTTRPLTSKMPPQLGNHVVSAWWMSCRHFRDEKKKLGRVNFRRLLELLLRTGGKNWPKADQLVPSIDLRGNGPLPSSKKPHFQNEAKCTTFLVKICMRVKNHLHINGWALNLVLMQRPGGTRKSPIARHISAPVPLSFLKWRIIYVGTWINVPLSSYERVPIF